MAIDKFLYEHPVFRFSELALWKEQIGSVKEQAAYQAIQYYLKTGRIVRIKRELYAVVPPNGSKETVSVDPYLIAGKASEDSVLGFHSALELHGCAYSSFEQFYFLSHQKIKPFTFAGQHFQSVAMPKPDKENLSNLVEVDVINRQGVDIRITSLVRSFVDALDRVKLSGGWEEVARSVDSIGALNIDRVIDYCLRMNRAVLSAKVGYFLERRQGAFSPTQNQMKRLLAVKPSQPQYASKKQDGPFKLIKKWNILLPVSVVEKSWEEPWHDI